MHLPSPLQSKHPSGAASPLVMGLGGLLVVLLGVAAWLGVGSQPEPPPTVQLRQPKEFTGEITPAVKRRMALQDISLLATAVRFYESSQGSLPASLDDVKGGGISEDRLSDPWGKPYVFTKPARRSQDDKFDLFSRGEKADDESDDIGNFKPN